MRIKSEREIEEKMEKGEKCRSKYGGIATDNGRHFSAEILLRQRNYCSCMWDNRSTCQSIRSRGGG